MENKGEMVLENKQTDKSRPMMIIIIVLLVVMIGAIATLAVFMMKRLNKMEAGSQSTEISEENPAKLSPKDIKQFSLGDPITTNLLKTDDVDHMIVVSLNIGIDYTNAKEADKLYAVLEESQEIARDIAISVIRNASYDLLIKKDGYDILKQSILQKLQDEFQTNLIVAVYMYDIRFA